MKTKYFLIGALVSIFLLPVAKGFTQVQDWEDPQIEFPKNFHGSALKSQVAINANPLLNDYDVKFYKLDIYADTLSDHIAGNVSILVEVVNNPMTTLVLELIDELTVDRVLIDDSEAVFTHTDDEINISLPEQATVGQMITAQVFYEGKTGYGMVTTRDKNWDFVVTSTLSEPFYAKHWFPCKQNLEDKADSVHVFITTDYGLMGVSNGLLTGTTYLPNGDVRYEWKSNYPIAFYLISIAVADYIEYSIEAIPEGLDSILIQNFVYDLPGCLDFYKEGIDITVDIMEVFCELFGPYPFREEKYGHYLWPWGGGMEHQTMTGMGNFSFYLVAHELGHSWFGDYVTCATWQDIWINEGFATLAGYLALEKINPDAAFAERERIFGRALLEPDGSVYVPAADAGNDSRIFSGNLSYNKGMSLLHMIRFILNDDDLFFQTLRDYIEVYADSVATGMDFKAELESSTGMDFTDFFEQWYSGFGYPIFDVSWGQVGATLTINSDQTTSSANTPLFKTPMEYQVLYNGGDTIVRREHVDNNEVYAFDMNHTVTGVVVDPNNHILDGQGGVKEISSAELCTQNFALYPNPNSGYFTVSSSVEWSGPLTIEVSNELNQIVYSEHFDNGSLSNQVIHTGIRDAGFYIVQIRSCHQIETHKIIIK